MVTHTLLTISKLMLFIGLWTAVAAVPAAGLGVIFVIADTVTLEIRNVARRRLEPRIRTGAFETVGELFLIAGF